ncbi:hypothetical protein GCM10008965_20270 [Methylorubrum aminovorans]
MRERNTGTFAIGFMMANRAENTFVTKGRSIDIASLEFERHGLIARLEARLGPRRRAGTRTRTATAVTRPPHNSGFVGG